MRYYLSKLVSSMLITNFFLQAIVNAVQEILVGDSDVVLTGGSDSMSACPYAVRDIRSGKFLRSGNKSQTEWK